MEKRFTESVSELLAERELSQRQLAQITKRRDGWGASGTISRMLAGDFPPSLEAMESIARALDVDPSVWPEFRMAQWRHDLNPERVGFPDAYATLREIELARG
jgi:transcriptional regulator with XRE-family HTH domain